MDSRVIKHRQVYRDNSTESLQKYLHSYILKARKVLVTQSCPILCNLRDCSLPGSSVQGILQARILEWVAISFSREPFRRQGEKKNFIARESHRSTGANEHLRSWCKKYMGKCVITARYFGKIMKSMISIYYEK